MSDEITKNTSQPPVKAEEQTKKPKTSEDVLLPFSGETTKIEKLKSGAYYQAQEIYVDWIQSLRAIFSEKLGINLEEVVDETGNPDQEKIKEVLSENEGKKTGVDISALLEKTKAASSKRLELLAVCLGKDVESVGNEFYPEDLDVLISKAIELNNFTDNLKKSVAPTVSLGA
jgi:hypothetical protein